MHYKVGVNVKSMHFGRKEIVNIFCWFQLKLSAMGDEILLRFIIKNVADT